MKRWILRCISTAAYIASGVLLFWSLFVFAQVDWLALNDKILEAAILLAATWVCSRIGKWTAEKAGPPKARKFEPDTIDVEDRREKLKKRRVWAIIATIAVALIGIAGAACVAVNWEFFREEPRHTASGFDGDYVYFSVIGVEEEAAEEGRIRFRCTTDAELKADVVLPEEDYKALTGQLRSGPVTVYGIVDEDAGEKYVINGVTFVKDVIEGSLEPIFLFNDYGAVTLFVAFAYLLFLCAPAYEWYSVTKELAELRAV